MQKPLVALAFGLLTACSSTQQVPIAAPALVAAPASTTVDHVSTLAARRAQVIRHLREYRLAGQYPTDNLGRPASVFVDANGVRCPMAHLIHADGRDDLVAAVASEVNEVRLADVREGPLYQWMLSSGLTLAEIDMIQGIPRGYEFTMEYEAVDETPVLMARVTGRLESIEVALRDATAASLATAAKRLPANTDPETLARAPIEGTAVPLAAIPKPSAPVASTRPVLRLSGFDN